MSVVAEGTNGYVGLFIPGHAPMVDLLKDKDLGKILVTFHKTRRPTGIICHGPIVLLSTLPDPDAFLASMIAGDGKASSLAKSWPYAGYRATIFSTDEEGERLPISEHQPKTGFEFAWELAGYGGKTLRRAPWER